VWAWPEYDAANVSAYGEKEAAVLRNMKGQPVGAHHNPGVRVHPDFVSPSEAQELLSMLKNYREKYGFTLITPHHAAMYRFQQSYLGRDAPRVGMMRVTGRPESAAQKPAPWGYGDAFDEAALPPAIKALVARARAAPGAPPLGRLRDVTVNFREGGFLRLDPHYDPQLDGGHVMILGLESDTVLTFCPGRMLQAADWLRSVWSAITLEDEREGVARVAAHSWTPLDIDVLARARSLVHMSGPARWSWTHGTRLGCKVEGHPGVHDWWGTRDTPMMRGATRTSVVLAFAEADK